MSTPPIRIIRRASRGPIEADEHRLVKPPTPCGCPEEAPPQPALDAYVLLALWRRYRMVGDVANERRTLHELEKLAQRPVPRAGDRKGAAAGEGDDDEGNDANMR